MLRFQSSTAQTDTARAVAGDPRPDHSPALRLIAWSILKTARGQTVRQARLQAMVRSGKVAA
ncbi:MAG TPA: hypothetical protein DIT40_08910 [Alphaproteobacteria bacterium]|nr:hypothetical protein [Alphaproteobacteria bacterium]